MPGRIKLEKFSIPLGFDPLEIADGDQKVIVVSVIGKGHHTVHHSKASIINQVVESDVFQGPLQGDTSTPDGGSTTFHIEGYYDEKEHVIYLHLKTLYDASMMVKLCQHANQVISKKGSYPFWQEAEFMHARALLYLFSVSHILVLVHPGCTFDVHYVRFFRTLDTIRQKLLPPLTDVLRGTQVSREWVLAGRPCSPRVLFVFENSTLDTGSSESDPAVQIKGRNQKTPPIKRLQHSIEDQVYRILRKARIITNISNNSLFAVPANQEFVYIHTKTNETRDIVGYYLNQLKRSCEASKESDAPRSRSYQINRHPDHSLRTSFSSGTDSASTQGTSSRSSSSYSYNFKDFLRQHIELAQTKGFDDNVGRNPLPAVFEIPTLSSWLNVFSTLHEFFMVDHADTKTRPHFNTLKSLLEVGLRFSEGRCAKVLPVAEGVYQEGLPQHYTKAYHLQALVSAKRKFMQHARGLAADKYLQQLADGCEKFWRTGRQLCEEISLMGNHCVNPLHVTSDFLVDPDSKHSLVMPHSSQVRTKAACNCGRTQAEKDDPFDHKMANYDFYERLNQQCCGKLESVRLPVFEPSTGEVKAAVTCGTRSPSVSETVNLASSSNPSLPSTTTSKPPTVRKDSARLEIGQAMSNLSLALSLDQSTRSSTRSNESDLMDSASVSSGHSAGSDLFVNDGHVSSFNAEGDTVPSQVSQDQHGIDIETNTQDVGTTAMLVRQHSTTEYLPGMLHSKSPPGLLPKFPSWSLVSLGKYSSYSPLQGLDQPGFLHSSNFLLPYDVFVTADREKWPVLGDTKKGKARKISKDSGETSVRLYLGNEYECPRGHRFFCSSPEKIFKVPPGGMTKENAHKIVTSDMPLYFPCHCRSSKGYIAQLMRIYIAVPEGPINIKLKPMVQPATAVGPAFHPGNNSPIPLTNGKIWVLRLPHFYMGDHGPYRIPADPQQVSACRLLRGLYLIQDQSSTTS